MQKNEDVNIDSLKESIKQTYYDYWKNATVCFGLNKLLIDCSNRAKDREIIREVFNAKK